MRRSIGFAVCALLALSAHAGRMVTFAWNAGADWPAGTTVELCANEVCAHDVIGTQHALDVPVSSGGIIDARARAVPPSGYRCGMPLADCPPSPWAMLSQTLPAHPVGAWATRQQVAAMAVEYKGYALVTGDYDGSVSQSVTVPAGATYALAYVGADTSRTFSAISLGGTAMTSIVTGSGAYGVNRLWGVATTEGSKTFAYTANGAFGDGGAAVLLFFSGVDSVRSSTGSGLNSLGTLSLASMASQSGDVAVIVGLHDGYSSPTAQDVDLNSQTKVVENANYNNRGYGAAYKTATGSTIVMQMYGDWPAACGAVLVPSGGAAATSLPPFIPSFAHLIGR